MTIMQRRRDSEDDGEGRGGENGGEMPAGKIVDERERK